MVRSQVRPKVIRVHVLDLLARRKNEIPGARTLIDLIALIDLIVGEIRAHKRKLTEVINAEMSPELR